MEASSGRLLTNLNGDAKLPIASLTKIMTAITVIENIDVNSIVEIGKESVGIEGSSMYLKEGQKYTVLELLYGLMLASGNDAAIALANFTGGSVENFSSMMNETARKLGLKNSHFVNPSGLDAEGHYSSALDLATLTAYALKNPVFSEIVSTKQKTIGTQVFVNHNRLLREIEGCIGVKTGYTKRCGRCLVSAVERNGVTLICVTLNCSNDWSTHKAQYDVAFSRCERVVLVKDKEFYRHISVYGGYDAGIYCEEISGVIVDGETDFIKCVYAPNYLFPNKKSRDQVGRMVVYQNDRIIAQGPVYLDRDLQLYREEKSKFRKLFDFILHLIGF